MRYIQKEKDNESNIIEPEELFKWKEQEKEILERWYNDDAITGTKMWASKSISSNDLEAIKEKLLKDQGYICCYCGSPIKNDHNTRIEHVNPKSKPQYKQQTFDYGNLLVSCQGGTRHIIHKVEEGETTESIAKIYNINVEFLEKVYVDITTENLEKFTKDYDLDNLQIGDRILIIPKVDVEQQHCDNRKGNREIEITPLQEDCDEKFTYDKKNGEIKITEETTKTIKTLGLNDNSLVNQRRLDVINESINLFTILLNTYPNPTELKEKVNIFITDYNTPDSITKKLEPYCFVSISILQGN